MFRYANGNLGQLLIGNNTVIISEQCDHITKQQIHIKESVKTVMGQVNFKYVKSWIRDHLCLMPSFNAFQKFKVTQKYGIEHNMAFHEIFNFLIHEFVFHMCLFSRVCF